LHSSHIYLAVGNAVDSVATNYDADILGLDISLPIESEEQVVELFEQVADRSKSVKVAVLDHISSCSAILFPVAKIAKALSRRGILVVVDGAHCPGQVELNLVRKSDGVVLLS